MVLLLAVLGLVLLLRVSVLLAGWHASRVATAPARPTSAAGRRRRSAAPAQLPEGHRPPPGLGPLSPSERFLSSEAARGLRELQVFLMERPA